MSTKEKIAKLFMPGEKNDKLIGVKYNSKKAFDPIVAHQSCWLVKDVNFSLYAWLKSAIHSCLIASDSYVILMLVNVCFSKMSVNFLKFHENLYLPRYIYFWLFVELVVVKRQIKIQKLGSHVLHSYNWNVNGKKWLCRQIFKKPTHLSSKV